MKSFEENKLQEEQSAATHTTGLAFEEANDGDEEDSKERADSRSQDDLGLDDGEYSSSRLPGHTPHFGALIPLWKSSRGYRFFIGPDCSLV
jgi:hypothetical protein